MTATDLPALKAAAVAAAGAIAEELLGERNRHASGRDRWHFGRGNGSLWVHLAGERAGTWHDGATGQGGDMIALTQHARATDFLGAVEWLRGFLGEGAADARPMARPALAQPQAPREASADDAAREARALETWHGACEGIEGKPAAAHLRSRRIDPARLPANTGSGWPAALRWHAASSALVIAVNDAASGLVRAVQTLALHPDGTPRRRANGSKVKLSFGPIAGRAVRFGWQHDAEGRWGIAEGPVTALAAAQLLGHPVWAALGAGNLPNVTPPSWARTATVVADHDDAGLAAAEEAARRLGALLPTRIIRAAQCGLDAADLAGAAP
ncbi:toprim domain-containing protein [Falsiroseomonas tokyonensis]|uniref:Toprim domain-containing protein n=1 Tax=Falsiroseomonas tokyonensis TaxID=430521 RepID=A0ABV7C162_9PROT|nr:toprim domain-containing protein [Falsiroseomonas tokyonensis]MBU8541605.1 toprim domain-containing protein [Falsiroseomonas tokyonensis]